MVTGRENRVGWTKELTELATGHRQRQLTPDTGSREASQHEIGSSEEDQVKMSAFQLLSLVIHASVSPYMLSEM